MLAETLKHVWKMLRVATTRLHIHDSLLNQKKEMIGKKKKSQIYVAGDAYAKKDGGIVVKQKRIELEMNTYEEI